MERASTFIFEDVSWNPHSRKIVLRYSLDHKIIFEETLILPDEALSKHLEQRQEQIDEALKALHLIGGISYYKTCCPTSIQINSGPLSPAEAQFWETIYTQGLGEFFYKNNIDFHGLIKFPHESRSGKSHQANHESKRLTQTSKLIPQTSRLLVPIGGGKDSLVSIELLKKTGSQITLLRMEPHPLIEELAHRAGLPMLTVRRSLSRNLFELNRQGALNGHIPITAYLSILSILIALLYDYDAVVMSDERSANVGNVTFKGLSVNHQWSKGITFEKMLRKHMAGVLKTSVEYFSLLRPLSELKIAELFIKSPQYFEHFTSCNRNWKILEANREPATGNRQRWCSHCPKCAFVFACLGAFLPKATLNKIFGSIFFANVELLPLFRELLGIENFKPFECVGTPEETQAAFVLAHKRGALNDTAAMKMFESEVLPTIKDPQALIDDALKPSKDHCIPAAFQSLIQ